jgi:hypothetical protein
MFLLTGNRKYDAGTLMFRCNVRAIVLGAVSLAVAAFLFVSFAIAPRAVSQLHAVRVRGPVVDLSSLTKNPTLEELIRREQHESGATTLPSSSTTTRVTSSPAPLPQPPPEPQRPMAAVSLRNRPSSLEVVKDASKIVFKRVVRASTLPASVLLMRERTARKLRECGQEKLSKMFEATYANTLETTGEPGNRRCVVFFLTRVWRSGVRE